MPGPPPKKDARHRGKPLANTLQLPAEGRKGSPPLWPGPGLLPGKSEQVWAELWATPMAVAWERYGWTRVVARYVLSLALAEKSLTDHEPDTKLLAEVRNYEDRLGLTPMAMLRLRWEITGDELAPRRDENGKPAPGGSRARLRAVDKQA